MRIPTSGREKPSEQGQFGFAVRAFVPQLNSTKLALHFLNYHSRLPLVSGSSVFSLPPPFENAYWTEYPEDIQLYGVSFNSTVGTWSLAGEVSYRPNLPLQFDDVEVLFAGLTPTNPLQPSYYFQFKSQLGEFPPGAFIQGWEEHKMWQAQATTTKLFGPGNIFRANQIAFVAEVGFNYISDLPAADWLRYAGPRTDPGGGWAWTSTVRRSCCNSAPAIT